jgi:hypothetical protein
LVGTLNQVSLPSKSKMAAVCGTRARIIGAHHPRLCLCEPGCAWPPAKFVMVMFFCGVWEAGPLRHCVLTRASSLLLCWRFAQESASLSDPRRLTRNVYVLSAGFFGIFIAYNTAQVRWGGGVPTPVRVVWLRERRLCVRCWSLSRCGSTWAAVCARRPNSPAQ